MRDREKRILYKKKMKKKKMKKSYKEPKFIHVYIEKRKKESLFVIGDFFSGLYQAKQLIIEFL